MLQPVGFTIAASNGYSLSVVGAEARKGRPATVVVIATGKNKEALYSTPGTVTETSFQADFGALGEIDVSFHPSGVARTARAECGGKAVSFDSGSYDGLIAFHGEEGFTTVEATSAPGDIGFLLDSLCVGISGGRGPYLPGAELKVSAKRSPFAPNLIAIKNRPSALIHFEVGVSEKRGRVSIGRSIQAIAPARAFEYDPMVQTATVHPPAPFSGTARFDRAGQPAKGWTGNLEVDLPGRSNVKLTGGRLRATLAHAHWDWHS